jgi:hemerythrin-like domain-containing protein
MKETRPIKRTKQLAPLSREHHDALVFLLRLKQGLKNGTASSLMSDYVKWFWVNNLAHHFEQEESLLLPVLTHEDEMAVRLKNEHQTIRRLVSEKLNEAKIALFTELLNAHIRFEEREFFPYIEKKISMPQLNEIFKKLDNTLQCQTTWEHAFWTDNR